MLNFRTLNNQNYLILAIAFLADFFEIISSVFSFRIDHFVFGDFKSDKSNVVF